MKKLWEFKIKNPLQIKNKRQTEQTFVNLSVISESNSSSFQTNQTPLNLKLLIITSHKLISSKFLETNINIIN